MKIKLRKIIRGIQDEWQYTVLNVLTVAILLSFLSFAFIIRAIISARVGIVEDVVEEIKIATVFVCGILALLIVFLAIMFVPVAKEEVKK